MSSAFLAALMLLSPAHSPSAPDQTADLLRVLAFIDAVKRGSDAQARQMLAPSAFVGDFMQKKATTIEAFAAYARQCPLSEVKVSIGRDGAPMPVGVEWYCPYPEYERHASFWLEGERISRIGWGKPITITPPVKSR